MNTPINTPDANLSAYEKLENRFKTYLTLSFGIYDLGYYAAIFGNYLFEDFPELFMDDNLGETTELIKARAQQATKDGQIDYSGFCFSKFRKLVERIVQSVSHDYWQRADNAVFTKEQRYHIKKEALYLLLKVPEIENIFATCGFDYQTDNYCYGDEKEKRLDHELDIFINANRIKKIEERLFQCFPNAPLPFTDKGKNRKDNIRNTALFLLDYPSIIIIFEKHEICYGTDLKDVDIIRLNRELDEKIQDIFRSVLAEQ